MKEFKQKLELWASPAPTPNSGLGVSTPTALTPGQQPFSFGGPSPNSLGVQAQPRSPLTAPATLGVAVPSYTPAYSPVPAPAIAPLPAPTPAVRMKPATFEVPARKF